MLNNPHSCVSDLVCAQELMELGEVRVRLEYIQQVQGQVDGFFEIVSQCARHSSEESLVI